MIFRLTERDLKTKFGDFREILYYDGQAESIAIVMGHVGSYSLAQSNRKQPILGGRKF